MKKAPYNIDKDTADLFYDVYTNCVKYQYSMNMNKKYVKNINCNKYYDAYKYFYDKSNDDKSNEENDKTENN